MKSSANAAANGAAEQSSSGEGTSHRNAAGPAAARLGRGQAQPNSDQIEVIRPLRSTSEVLTLEAWDYSLKRAVMIRTLAPQARQNSAVVNEFWRQARVQAQLRHDHVLPVLFIDTASDWVVTEFCERSLRDEQERSGLSAERVRRILVQALEGLDYLHEQGQLHGQIHPEIILVGDDDSIKLDWPSGRDIGAELPLRPGLEKYAAPESLDEIRFGAVTGAADIYALGIVVLELLAGKRFLEFFRGYDLNLHEGGDTWLRWHLSAEARLPRVNEILPKVPAVLASVIDRMVEKSVSQRLNNPQAALTALATTQLGPVSTAQPRVVSVPARSIVQSSVHAVEPMLGASQGIRPNVISSGGTANERSIKSWTERLLTENNSNYLAAAMILLAAFVAGLSLVGSTAPQVSLPRMHSDDSTAKSSSQERAEPLVEAAKEPEFVEKNSDPPPAPEARPATDTPLRREPVAQPKKTKVLDGRLRVSVKPSGAWVRFQGENYKQGALNRLLPQGEYLVEAGKWDCHPQQKTILVRPGEDSSYQFLLEQRPACAPYEPILYVSHEGADQADAFVKGVLQDSILALRRPTSLIGVSYRLKEEPQLAEDPRVLHAVAVAALGPEDNARRASFWYGCAARISPVFYSWPHKGYVKCLLAEGKCDEAAREAVEFATAAQRLANHHSSNHKAQLLLVDAAIFAGRAIGLAEALSPRHDELSLASRELASRLDEEVATAFQGAKDETLARYQETMEGHAEEPSRITWQFLGDSSARERRMLLESIGCRSRSGFKVKIESSTQSSCVDRTRGTNEFAHALATHAELLIGRSRFGN